MTREGIDCGSLIRWWQFTLPFDHKSPSIVESCYKFGQIQGSARMLIRGFSHIIPANFVNNHKIKVTLLTKASMQSTQCCSTLERVPAVPSGSEAWSVLPSGFLQQLPKSSNNHKGHHHWFSWALVKQRKGPRKIRVAFAPLRSLSRLKLIKTNYFAEQQ